MTSGHFFVSGYNVISVWPELRELGNLGTWIICIICQGVL
jgi:hypothetical protein